MPDDTLDWPAFRVFHFAGGVRADDFDAPTVGFQTKVLSGQVCRFRGKSYRSVFADFSKLKLSLLGVDFYFPTSNNERRSPPSWRVFSRGWPSDEQRQGWSFIASSAFNERDGYAWDLASRLTQQWRICNWRVRQISEAYANQLDGCTLETLSKHGEMFEDGFTSLVYDSVQSYLVDAGVLRDYLIEFVVNIYWKSKRLWSGGKVTTLGGLLSKANRKLIPDADLLGDLILEISKSGEWLSTMGQYRDLVVHTAPLGMAGPRLHAIVQHLKFPHGSIMPSIKFPLPSNPEKIRMDRAKGIHFEELFSKLIKSFSDLRDFVDALGYVSEVHSSLAKLSNTIMLQSPIEGRIPVITEADIIGEIKIERM